MAAEKRKTKPLVRKPKDKKAKGMNTFVERYGNVCMVIAVVSAKVAALPPLADAMFA